MGCSYAAATEQERDAEVHCPTRRRSVVVITVIVLLLNVIRNATFIPASKPAITPTPEPASGAPSRTAPGSTITATPARSPLVVAPNIYGATCGSGIALPEEHGWPTRGGRGTRDFMRLRIQRLEGIPEQLSVARQRGSHRLGRRVVPCDATEAQCAGEKVAVQCAFYGIYDWITCTDGQNDRVYLF